MARKTQVQVIAAPSDSSKRDDWFAAVISKVKPFYEKKGMMLPTRIEWQLDPNPRVIHTRIRSYPDHKSDGWAINLPGASRDVEILLAHVCLGLDMALFVSALRREGKDFRAIAVGPALYRRKAVEGISRLMCLILTENRVELTVAGRAVAAELDPYPGNTFTKATATKPDPGPVRAFCPFCQTAIFMRQADYRFILENRPMRWLEYSRFCFRDDCSRTLAGIPLDIQNYSGDDLDEKVIPIR